MSSVAQFSEFAAKSGGELCAATVKTICTGKYAEKLAADCGISSAIKPLNTPRAMHCFNFVTRLISLFLLFLINKIHPGEWPN